MLCSTLDLENTFDGAVLNTNWSRLANFILNRHEIISVTMLIVYCF